MRVIKRILIALSFLTILPGIKKIEDEKEFGKSMAYYPLAGLAIGAILYYADQMLGFYSPLAVKTVVIGSLWMILTGALHIEGFADSVDGFSAGGDKETILKVMKDKHCGSKGAAGVAMLVASKMILIYGILQADMPEVLLITPVISRWAMVIMAFFSTCARNEEGLGKVFINNTGIGELIISSVVAVLAGLIIAKELFVISGVAVLLLTFLATVYLKKKLGGATGDLLGALNEIAEVLVLLVCCAVV